jgi:NAD(P)-dependent dehydrogenase (short-subunit alcohol dehydrogenase family)
MSVFPGIEGKVAVVTGAARGLGAEIAATLAEHGATVAVLDLDETTAREVAARIPRAEAFACDVTDPASVEQARAAVAAGLGPARLLVNNAGVVAKAPLEELSLAEWRSVLAVNLDGVFLCTQVFGRSMLELGGGAIVNVSSIAAVAPSPLRGAYSSSKAALTALTRQTAIEWGPRGVRANVVCPGVHAQGMQTIEMRRSDAQREMIPLRRFATSADITPTIAFLCSDLASYVSGGVFTVDGGFSHVIVSELVERSGD